MTMRGTLDRSFKSILNYRFTMADFLKAEILLVVVLVCLLNHGYPAGSITYLIDMVNLVLFVVSIKRIARRTHGTRSFDVPFVIFVIFCLFTSAINLVAPQLVFWEALSFGRLFIWIYLFRAYWTFSDVADVMNCLYKLQVLNAAVVAFQYFFLHLKQDNVGGVFGVNAGCNAPLNMYLCIVCVWGLSGYLSKKIKLGSMAMTFVSALIIAVVAELKIFYIELVVLILLGMLYCRFSRKTIVAAVVIVCMATAGMWFLLQFDPVSFETLVSPEKLFEYSDMQGSGYGVSRINVFTQLSDLFFSGDSAQRAFGMGFGSVSQSSIAFFTSDFFYSYGSLNYFYLITAMLYLQVGYVGAFLYFVPFILLAGALFVKRGILLKLDIGRAGCTTFVICFLFILNAAYNSTAHNCISVLWALAISVGLFALASVSENSPADVQGVRQ